MSSAFIHKRYTQIHTHVSVYILPTTHIYTTLYSSKTNLLFQECLLSELHSIREEYNGLRKNAALTITQLEKEKVSLQLLTSPLNTQIKQKSCLLANMSSNVCCVTG